MISATLKRRLGATSLLVAAALVSGCESKEEKAVKFAESGQDYLAEGDLDRADLQFNNALFQDGTNVSALEGAAEIARQRGDNVRYARMLLRLLEQDPMNIEANNEAARLSLLGGEHSEARRYAERVLEQEPANVKALSTIGAILVLENRLEEAETILNQALAEDPDNAEIFNLKAAVSIRSDNFEEAMATIDEGIETAENPEPLLVVKLVLAERFRGREEVIDTFERLIELSPENGLYRQRMADYYLLKDRDFERARQLYIEALPFLEDRTEVYTRIVSIDRETDGDQAAEATLRQFAAENPDDIDLRFALPAFYCQTGRVDRCRQEYVALAENEDFDPDTHIRALNGLADVALVQNDIDAAGAAADEVLEIDPGNPEALVTRAQILYRAEQPDAAIELLREALQSDPDNAEGLVFLALAYEQSGQVQFADAQFAKALDQVGYEKGIVDRYRAFLIRQGEQDRANEVLERYLRENPSDIDAIYQRAEFAMSEGRFQEAEQVARQLMQRPTLEQQGTSLLARALAGQERFEEALPYAVDASDADPTNERLTALRISLLDRLGRRDEAAAEVRSRVESGSAEAIDYAVLSGILRDEGDVTQAREVASDGLAAFPRSERLYVLRYLAEKDLNEDEAALMTLRQGAENAETKSQIRNFLANDLIAANRMDEALEVLETLENTAGLSPIAANNLAALLIDREGGAVRALELAERFAETENPYFADTYAWALHKNGRTDEAAPYARLAVERLPQHPDVLYHHGVIEAELGNADVARQSLERARDAISSADAPALAKIEAALAGL
jgi:tetratricopeptide (TPR) repeat protein